MRFGQSHDDYYTLLTHGFLKGQLSLDLEVPPALLSCPDPYDPAQRPPGAAHDAVLFGGRYYIYHGVTPVLTLLLPFRLITGVDLPLALAVWVFCLVGTAAIGAMLLDVVRRCRPETSPWALAGVTIAVWLGGMTTVLLCRHSFYDLAIAGGFCFSALAVYALARAMREATPAPAWLSVSSLCWGLAIGARPNLVVACVGVCAVVALPRVWRDQRRLAALVLPFMAVAVGLASYNHARFGNPFESGWGYQLTALKEADQTHFSLRYIAYNLHAYFLACPTLQP